MNMTSRTPEDNSHTILVECGPRLGEYQGVVIREWFITADGYKHTYLEVCEHSQYFKRCLNIFMRKTGMEMSEMTANDLMSVTTGYNLLYPGLLYESQPIHGQPGSSFIEKRESRVGQFSDEINK